MLDTEDDIFTSKILSIKNIDATKVLFMRRRGYKDDVKGAKKNHRVTTTGSIAELPDKRTKSMCRRYSAVSTHGRAPKLSASLGPLTFPNSLLLHQHLLGVGL